MKNKLRAFAGLLAVMLLICSCGKESYAIRVGGQVVSEGTFARQAATLKDYLSEMESDLSKEEEFEQYVCDYLIDLKLYAQKFEDLNLSFDAREEEEIDTYLSEVISGYESITVFQQALAQAGYTYDEYLEEVYDFKKKAKVLEYYFGAEGETPTTDQQLKDYYAAHNAVIKYVAISNEAQKGEAATGEKKEEAKKRAEEAYAEAIRPGAADRFEEVIELFSEDTSTREIPIVINDANAGKDTLSAKVLAMEVGQVILVDVEDGYMVVRRYDATDEAHFTAQVRQSVLEEYRAKEIDALLEAWRGEVSVKINRKVTEKYAKLKTK